MLVRGILRLGVQGSVLSAASVSPLWLLWFDASVNVGTSLSHAAPLEVPPQSVSFVEVLVALDDDDRGSVTSEKAPPCEGLPSVMRLLFQLCPYVASAVPKAPQVCDFEGLLTSVARPPSGEISTNLFPRVAELLSETCLHFQMAMEAKKLPAAGLPLHRRGPGACSDPSM